MRAHDFCTNAAKLMDDRADTRDTDGERSMARCVDAFNALYGHTLTEVEGWQFMSLLKKSRGVGGGFRRDDYEDDVAYCALAGEAAAEVHNLRCRTPHKKPLEPTMQELLEESRHYKEPELSKSSTPTPQQINREAMYPHEE